MILHLTTDVVIENLRNYPEEIVEKLRTLLRAGIEARPDPRRKDFYDVVNGSLVFYIHLSPTGKVLLLAAWLNSNQHAALERQPNSELVLSSSS